MPETSNAAIGATSNVAISLLWASLETPKYVSVTFGIGGVVVVLTFSDDVNMPPYIAIGPRATKPMFGTKDILVSTCRLMSDDEVTIFDQSNIASENLSGVMLATTDIMPCESAGEIITKA